MADFGLVKTFARELVSRRVQSRTEPPSIALEPSIIIEALRTGGSASGRFAAGYAFHTAHMALTIYGASNCLDLGAAPGCQLLQLAELLPDTKFIGVDKSRSLLAEGESQSKKLGLENVSWIEDDICLLESFPDDSVDAVISTMTLHDLPSLADVERCLSSVARVIRPDGAIYIEDYARLKSPKSVAYFNQANTAFPDDAFATLNACSLHAAFTIDELSAAFERHLPDAHLYSTYLIPFLNVAKTPDREIPTALKTEIRALRDKLPTQQRTDLDDLRKFFGLGGWRKDPFS